MNWMNSFVKVCTKSNTSESDSETSLAFSQKMPRNHKEQNGGYTVIADICIYM